jgi:hypothetical protein
MTVPIYWGCPNISDFFDVRGMLFVQDFRDFLNVVNSLTPETYQLMLPYVQKNYELCKPFTTITDRVKTVVDQILIQSLK